MNVYGDIDSSLVESPGAYIDAWAYPVVRRSGEHGFPARVVDELARLGDFAVPCRSAAGRTEPGVCYRLWDEPQTQSLPAFAEPEIREQLKNTVILFVGDNGTQDDDPDSRGAAPGDLAAGASVVDAG